MTRVDSSAAWTAYFITHVAGFAALMYLTRSSPLTGAVVWLPFLLPATLIAILSVGAYAEEREPVREQLHRPLLGKAFGRIAPPLRTYPLAALSMVNPLTTWMYPATASSQLRAVFDAWWLACALTAWIVIPRIFSAENRRPLRS